MAATKVIRLHAEAIPVEPLEIGFVHSRRDGGIAPYRTTQQLLGDRSVGIAEAAHGEGRSFLDSPFRYGDAIRARNACSEFAGEVHPHAREALEKRIHAEERSAPKARLPRGLVGQSRRGVDIGDVIVIAKNAHNILRRLNHEPVAGRPVVGPYRW